MASPFTHMALKIATICLLAFGLTAPSFAQQTASDSVHRKVLVYELFNQIYAAIRPTELKSDTVYSEEKIALFGWHPGWSDHNTSSYDFNVLSALVYAETTISLSGNSLAYNTPNWTSPQTSALLTTALNAGTEVYLSIKCLDTDAMEVLFTDQQAQAAAIKEIIALTNSQDSPLNGVCLVFEGVNTSLGKQYMSFIQRLSTALKSENKKLTLSLPAIPRTAIYDFKVLNSVVDKFIIQAYNYQERHRPSAVAPLTEGNFNISNTVNAYLYQNIPPQKLIITLPYFGAVWRQGIEGGNATFEWVGRRNYAGLRADIGTSKVSYNTDTTDAIVRTKRDGLNYIYHFDNDKTLAKKMEWIKAKNLDGIGMWALGYDTGRPELWNTLRANISTGFIKSTQTIAKVDTAKTVDIDNLEANATEKLNKLLTDTKHVIQQKEVLFTIGILLPFFLVIAIAVTLVKPEVYEKLFITDFSLFLKLAMFLVVLVVICITVSNFVFETDPTIANQLEPYANEPVLVSGSINAQIIKYGFLSMLLLCLLSWKVFLNFNRDTP